MLYADIAGGTGSKPGGGVLLIDEVAHLQHAQPSAFAWLRSLSQSGTAVFMAGAHDAWSAVVRRAAAAPGSSFGNDVRPIDLGPLDRESALAFLETISPPDARLDRQTAGRWIVELWGTWPFYLQVLGFAIVPAARSGNRRPTRRACTRCTATSCSCGTTMCSNNAGPTTRSGPTP